MRAFAVCLLGVLTFGIGNVSAAPVVIDFEALADGEVLSTQYGSLTFSNATALVAGISLNEFDFPPHSGSNVVFDDGGAMSIAFAAPILSFGGFFTYGSPLTLTAFDAGHNAVATVSSAFLSNLGLDAGAVPNEFLTVLWASGIYSVTIAGDPFGGSFTLDDATVTALETSTVPEPGTVVLMGIGLAVIAGRQTRGYLARA
jgi:hypothetical protein